MLEFFPQHQSFEDLESDILKMSVFCGKLVQKVPNVAFIGRASGKALAHLQEKCRNK